MAELQRKFDFAAGELIRASELNTEFDQLRVGHNARDLALGASPWQPVLAGAVRLTGGIGGFTSPWGRGLFGEVGVLVPTWTAWGTAPTAIYLDDADFVVSGRTAQFRMVAHAYTNSVPPNWHFSVGLLEITSAFGGADQIILTTEFTEMPFLEAVFAPPAASSRKTEASGTDSFQSGGGSLPNDMWWAMAVAFQDGNGGAVGGNVLPVGSSLRLAGQLQVRWV